MEVTLNLIGNRIRLFCIVVDIQLQELNNRFNETNKQ